jgi:hypothetical protein
MPTFVDVQVESHDALPDGCSRRFKSEGATRPVTLVRYEPEDAELQTWKVEAAYANGTRGPARAVPIEDSSAGTSILVVGGDHGLRLAPVDGGREISEAYLLLSPSAVLG